MSEAQITFYVHDKKNREIFCDYFRFDQHKNKTQSFVIPEGGKFLKIWYYNGTNENLCYKDCKVQAQIVIYTFDVKGKLLSFDVDSFDENKIYTDCHMIKKRTTKIKISYEVREKVDDEFNTQQR